MNEQPRRHEGQDYVAPDESRRVADPGKARAMADSSDVYRSAERDFIAEQRELEQREASGDIKLGVSTKLSAYPAAQAKERGQWAEDTEQSAELRYEVDRIVDAVSKRVSVESVYTQELRMIEAERDLEAFQRVLDQLSSLPTRSKDTEMLKRLTHELSENVSIQFSAFNKLQIRAEERLGGKNYWEKYNAYKASKQEVG